MTAAAPSLARATVGVGVWNLLSRVTGLARVVVMAGALGATHLGDTYQSANIVSNVVFELVAGGMLSAALVPAFVRRLDAGDEQGADALAGRMLGLALAVTGVLAILGMLAARPITQALTVAVTDPEVRAQRVELGATLLRWFLPQLCFYAVGAVATALLHARRRFTAAALAPVANNAVVIVVLGWFWMSRQGAPSLGLDRADVVLLGAGTTAGVVAMTLVPWLALGRARPHLRAPGLDDPAVRSVASDGIWAAGHLGLNQAMVAATLVVANGVEGGAVAYQIAFTCFLLPHALLANPVYTTTFPELASAAATPQRFAGMVRSATHATAALVVPAAGIGAAAAAPVLVGVAAGAFDGAAALLVAATLAAYLVGLFGYSTMFLGVRAAFASGRPREPAIVNAAVLVALVLGLWAVSATTSGTATMVGIGLAHSVAVTVGAVVLLARVAVPDVVGALGPALGRLAAVAVGAAVLGRVAGDVVGVGSRPSALLAALVASVVAGAVVATGGLASGWRDARAVREALR